MKNSFLNLRVLSVTLYILPQRVLLQTTELIFILKIILASKKLNGMSSFINLLQQGKDKKQSY